MRALLALFVMGCGGYFYKRSPPVAPDEPVPLTGLNTPFDDYNAAKPPNLHDLVYSTSRGSEGKDLDVWSARILFDREPHVGTPVPFAPTLMSSGNERGPLVVPADQVGVGYSWKDVLVLASDRAEGKGGFDLYWAMLDNPQPPLEPLPHINSEANDVYLTLPYGERRALFASDRGGAGYDIYELAWSGERIDSPVTISRVDALSSTADDSAPYVDPQRGIVVFASTRDGGAGGWDLWCATRAPSGEWSAPRPLSNINTSSDEFRPSLFTFDGAHFMVFSSNRPGGAGGYDLYTVRFDRCPV